MGKSAFLFLTILLLTGLAGEGLNAQCRILLWEDDFEADTLDSGRWNVAFDNSGGGNNELQFYTPRDTNIYIEEGKLIIRALEEEYGNRDYTSAKITTRGIADWRYGRIEAKIKTPEGKGIWPAFWMMPAENVYGTWPESGEIDIMELIGDDPSTVYGTIHYGPPHNYSNGIYTLPEGKFADSMHVFAIEWNEDTIKWFVDDSLYSFKTAADLERPEQWAAFNERFYLILNLAVGGDWPGSPDETTLFPQTMEVDYVRVYGDPAQQEITASDSAYALAEGVKYSFSDIPGASYTWQVPEGAVIEGQGTHTIEVNWGCIDGDVLLEVSDIDCGNQNFSLPVTFSKPAITGRTEILPLDTAVFAVPLLAETNYLWEIPEDVNLLDEQGNMVLVQWGCEEGYVKVNLGNNCENHADSLQVSLKTPVISGPTTVSEYSRNVLYKIDDIPQSDYLWSVPGDAVITDGLNNDSVYVDLGQESGNVSVEVTNICGTEEFSLPVRITDTILIADYETMSPEFLTFSSSEFKVVNNPQKDEINSSDHVAESFKSEVAWSGIYTDLGYNLDLSRHRNFSIKVLGPKAGVVLLKLEDILEGDVQPVEEPADYTTPGQWQVLEYSFPTAPSEAFDRITLFFDFGSEDENIFYFDDLYLLPAEGLGSNQLKDENEIHIFPNPFRYSITLKSEREKIQRVQLMDAGGKIVYDQKGPGHEGILQLNYLDPGVYLVRIYSEQKILNRIIVKQ